MNDSDWPDMSNRVTMMQELSLKVASQTQSRDNEKKLSTTNKRKEKKIKLDEYSHFSG